MRGNRMNPARVRWKLLADTLKKRMSVAGDLLPSGSVRKFQSFGLLQLSCLSGPWHRAEMRVDHQSYHVEIRFSDRQLQANELIGFNNTGNVCVWPSEEVLTYFCLKNLTAFEGLRVCELGGGMTSLAALFLAKFSHCSRVILTDGNDKSVGNLTAIASHCAEQGGFATQPEVRRLRWGDTEDMADLSGAIDLLLVADCFFFDDSRQQLADSVATLLSPGGFLLGFAPERSGSVDQFVSLMTARGFDVVATHEYDPKISRLADQFQRTQADFVPNLHYPILLRVSKTQQHTEFA